MEIKQFFRLKRRAKILLLKMGRMTGHRTRSLILRKKNTKLKGNFKGDRSCKDNLNIHVKKGKDGATGRGTNC